MAEDRPVIFVDLERHRVRFTGTVGYPRPGNSPPHTYSALTQEGGDKEASADVISGEP